MKGERDKEVKMDFSGFWSGNQMSRDSITETGKLEEEQIWAEDQRILRLSVWAC